MNNKLLASPQRSFSVSAVSFYHLPHHIDMHHNISRYNTIWMETCLRARVNLLKLNSTALLHTVS